VTPDQVQEVAVAVLAHRLVLDPQAQYSGQSQQSIVEEIVRQVAVPV
jgi:MoxR-like ATPase